MSEQERRRAIISIPEYTIAQLLDLPEGVSVVSVHANWHRNTIEVLLEGDKLPVHHPGTEPVHLFTGQEVMTVPWDETPEGSESGIKTELVRLRIDIPELWPGD